MFWQPRGELHNLTACRCIMEDERGGILHVTHQMNEEQEYVPRS